MSNTTAATICGESLNFHLGSFYNVLIVGLLLGYLVMGVLCVRDLIAYRKTQKKFEVDLKITIYSMTIFSDFTRVLWLLDPHTKSMPFGFKMFDALSSVILLKIGQVVLISALLLLILIWRQLVQAAQKMKAVKGMGRSPKIVGFCISLLCVVVFPMNILEAVDVAPFLTGTISNGTLALMVLSMMVCGVIYATKLTAMMASMGGSSKKTVTKIRKVIVTLVIASITLIFGVVFRAVAINLCNGASAHYLYIIFILSIHVPEIVASWCLWFTVASAKKSKKGGFRGKNQSASGDSSVVSTASD
jgi:hypothetical protein